VESASQRDAMFIRNTEIAPTGVALRLFSGLSTEQQQYGFQSR